MHFRFHSKSTYLKDVLIIVDHTIEFKSIFYVESVFTKIVRVIKMSASLSS
jgi:hypothetical protein